MAGKAKEYAAEYTFSGGKLNLRKVAAILREAEGEGCPALPSALSPSQVVSSLLTKHLPAVATPAVADTGAENGTRAVDAQDLVDIEAWVDGASGSDVRRCKLTFRPAPPPASDPTPLQLLAQQQEHATDQETPPAAPLGGIKRKRGSSGVSAATHFDGEVRCNMFCKICKQTGAAAPELLLSLKHSPPPPLAPLQYAPSRAMRKLSAVAAAAPLTNGRRPQRNSARVCTAVLQQAASLEAS